MRLETAGYKGQGRTESLNLGRLCVIPGSGLQCLVSKMGVVLSPSHRFVVNVKYTDTCERFIMVPIIKQFSIMLGKRSKEQKPYWKLTKFSTFSP